MTLHTSAVRLDPETVAVTWVLPTKTASLLAAIFNHSAVCNMGENRYNVRGVAAPVRDFLWKIGVPNACPPEFTAQLTCATYSSYVVEEVGINWLTGFTTPEGVVISFTINKEQAALLYKLFAHPKIANLYIVQEGETVTIERFANAVCASFAELGFAAPETGLVDQFVRFLPR